MKQIETTKQIKTGSANFNRSAMSLILRSFGRLSTALKPTKEDLNFTRWQELECRDYRVSDRFNQIYDRRFK